MDTKDADYNLHNYVCDFNDSFDDKPFNEIDGLVLSQIANMNFENLGIDIYSGEGKTIQQIYEAMNTYGSPAYSSYKSMSEDSCKLIEELAMSERFKDMVLSNYVNNPVIKNSSPIEGFGAVNDEDSFMEQFAAVTITFNQNGEIYNYMAFQATNDTTNGWTEDFAMLARNSTQAQKDSVDYMNIVGRYLVGHIIGGGHSKGGNDFEYGYLFCDEEIRQRIEKGYIYDSPGLSDDVLARTDRFEIFQEIIKDSFICPQDSIIGQLLHENDNAVFVHSVESGFLEHDPYTWEINKDTGKFESAEKQSELSMLINKALDDGVSGMTKEQRVALFEFIQYLMYNNGGKSLDGIINLATGGWENPGDKIKEIWTVLSGAWNSMNEEERKNFIDSLGVLLSSIIVNTVNYYIEKVDEWVKNKIESFESKISELWNLAVDWVQNKKEEFKEFLGNLSRSFGINIRKISSYMTKLYEGYNYAINNPKIDIDTYKLSDYAQRLQKINGRIVGIDKRLDALYWKVGFLDLWNLIQADIIIGYSLRLSKCSSYLSGTALDFINVENDLVSRLQ